MCTYICNHKGFHLPTYSIVHYNCSHRYHGILPILHTLHFPTADLTTISSVTLGVLQNMTKTCNAVRQSNISCQFRKKTTYIKQVYEPKRNRVKTIWKTLLFKCNVYPMNLNRLKHYILLSKPSINQLVLFYV